MTSALFALALIVAAATPSPAPSGSPSNATCNAARAIVQTVTYPDRIALSDAFLQHVHALHPSARYVTFYVLAHIDGGVTARVGDDPVFDDELRRLIIAYGSHIVVTPVTHGCTGISSAFQMIVTIPEGRVHLEPVDTSPGPPI